MPANYSGQKRLKTADTVALSTATYPYCGKRFQRRIKPPLATGRRRRRRNISSNWPNRKPKRRKKSQPPKGKDPGLLRGYSRSGVWRGRPRSDRLCRHIFLFSNCFLDESIRVLLGSVITHDLLFCLKNKSGSVHCKGLEIKRGTRIINFTPGNLYL
jgi:hypothetical protein